MTLLCHSETTGPPGPPDILCPRDLLGGGNFLVVYIPDDGDLIPGSTARFACRTDYRQVPQSGIPDEVLCQEDGTWSRRQPITRCERKIDKNLKRNTCMLKTFSLASR